MCVLGLRENEELGEWNRVHLAEGEVLEPALPDEGDVQQLRGGGGGLGRARGQRPLQGGCQHGGEHRLGPGVPPAHRLHGRDEGAARDH